jgi:transposase
MLTRPTTSHAVAPRIARKGIESSEHLGRHRWTVERTISWLLAQRRLATRYERRADILTGLLHLACSLIALRFLTPDVGL